MLNNILLKGKGKCNQIWVDVNIFDLVIRIIANNQVSTCPTHLFPAIWTCINAENRKTAAIDVG